MEAYSKFAQVYDLFMDNIDYEGWADYVTDRLKEYGITDGLVLELGCGTGTMTGLLADRGYDMIGVDNSEEMLAEAMEKESRTRAGYFYLYYRIWRNLNYTHGTCVVACDVLRNLISRREKNSSGISVW